jgi:pyruvate dehydrogenase E1 component alpha subunit
MAVRLRESCANIQDPPPSRIFSNVYAEENPVLDGEREELLGYLASFGGEH